MLARLVLAAVVLCLGSACVAGRSGQKSAARELLDKDCDPAWFKTAGCDGKPKKHASAR